MLYQNEMRILISKGKINYECRKSKKKHCKLPIYCVSERFLEYEEWYDKFEDFIKHGTFETGADREMDFDSEREFEKRYEIWIINKGVLYG